MSFTKSAVYYLDLCNLLPIEDLQEYVNIKRINGCKFDELLEVESIKRQDVWVHYL